MAVGRRFPAMDCPICGAARQRLLFSFRKPDLPGEPCYQVFECSTCRAWHADGPLNDDILAAVYNESFHRSSQQSARRGEAASEASRSPVVVNAQRRVERIRRIRTDGSLLDIGAGRGYFVKCAQAYFRTSGIEYSPHAVRGAREDGVALIADDFMVHEFGGDRFDVITLWDVLASLRDPDAAIAKVSSLLVPGGTLVMTVPYVSSWPARLLRRYWPLMIPPINLTFFNRRSLRVLLARHGFSDPTIETEGKRVTLDFLLKKLFRTLGLHGLQKSVPSWMAGTSVYLNLGDVATVYATKGPASER